MALSRSKAVAASETYFNHLRLIRASGGGTDERSYYTPLTNFLNAVGDSLRPKVFCVDELAEQGAGHPDLGLYAASQLQRRRPKQGQIPERGVVEVKPSHDDAWLTVETDQVSRYWDRYRLVLVTNTRDFVLLGENSEGRPIKLETFRTAQSSEEFEELLRTPRAFANKVGVRLGEYLSRILSHQASLAEPRDLAWFLASYARDGLSRVEASGDAPSLESLRTALENALGIRFEGVRGAAFFHSTLVQTLFYGVFSAWVLWARSAPAQSGSFNWREAVWHLRVPVLKELFHQLVNPNQLQPLGLVELLNWTSAALDRVDIKEFFDRFNEEDAVAYFYEPFLQEFDPKLRKALGAWYTPTEIVRYMVARVDRSLKDDLGITAGLAGENVYVLDPCCGTGAYIVEVLRRIKVNLEEQNLGALIGSRLIEAATERVFGFEIMPAPFVVAHLQSGLALDSLGAPLGENTELRPGIYLTNALTGWEVRTQDPLPFNELQEERDRALRVKHNVPVLVILGNPPYNGFAGVAIDEEHRQLETYRTTKNAPLPDTRGLNDLYVRFFRVAEQRIAEKTGRGIVCFISNYSWLDGRSFAGMRERYLEQFDSIRIDNLHGDRIVSEYAPDGKPSETIFAIKGKSPGIKVGTAIALLSKSGGVIPATDGTIKYRDFNEAKAEDRRQGLLDSLDGSEVDSGYISIEPETKLGLPFKPMNFDPDWHHWPSITELFPVQFSGVNTNRDGFVVDFELATLRTRITEYFNPELDHDEVAQRYPVAMGTRARFNPRDVRETLLRRGGPVQSGFMRYSYRPFDTRWLYWEADTKLLNEKRPDYVPHVFEGNLWLSAVPHLRKDMERPQAYATSHAACLHLIERGANMFPMLLRHEGFNFDGNDSGVIANLSPAAERYLARLELGVEELFHHVLAVLHDPTYLSENAGALQMSWPRIPVPGWPDGAGADIVSKVTASSDRGKLLASLLDSDAPVPGVTTGELRTGLAQLAIPTKSDGTNMVGHDFKVTANWGYFGPGQAIMPSQGKTVERSYSTREKDAASEIIGTLGKNAVDVYLNDKTYWRNVPSAVWEYKLGGYQVLKKWLSYREFKVLGRALTPDEVQHFSETTRRIAAIIELTHRSS